MSKNLLTRLFLLIAALFLGMEKHAQAQLDDGIYAVFDMTQGVITAQLHYVEAPMAVANFIGLAEGTRAWRDERDGSVNEQPFYDGTIVNRIANLGANLIVQAGTLTGSNSSIGPGFVFKDEFDPTLRHDKFGTLSLANSGKNTNSSQFFFSLGFQGHLDDVHTIFGQLISGTNVLINIANVPLTNGRPTTDVVFNQISIFRVGTDANAFDIHAQNLPIILGAEQTISSVVPGEIVLDYNTGTNNVFEFWSSIDLVNWNRFSTVYKDSFNDPLDNLFSVTGTSMLDFLSIGVIKTSYPYTLYSPETAVNLTVNMPSDNLVINMGSSARTGTITYDGVSGNIVAASDWNATPHDARFAIRHDVLHEDFVEEVENMPDLIHDILSFRFFFDSETNGTYTGSINTTTNTFVEALQGGDFTFEVSPDLP